MLSRKFAPLSTPFRLSEAQLPVDSEVAEQQRLLSQIEVTSLQIEQDPDVGSDPYNRTGQFCVVDIVKNK